MADAAPAAPASPPSPGLRATPAPSPRRPRRPFRFALKLLAWLVAILTLLLLLAFAFLQTGPGRDFAKGIALDALNGTFRGHFSIDEIAGTLPFDVELRGVRITDPDGVLVIGVESLRADFAPLALLSAEVRVSNVEAEGATVAFFDDQKRIALLRAFELRTPPVPTAVPSPWQVHLEGIHVTRGTLERLVPAAPAEALALAPLEIALTLRIADGGLAWSNLTVTAVPRGDSRIARALRSPDAPMGAILVVSDGVLGASAVTVERLQIQAGPHAVSLAGHIALVGLGSRPDAARLTIDDLRLDVAALGAFVPSLAAFTDEVRGSGFLALDEGRASLALEVSSADARVSVHGDGRFLGTDGLFSDQITLGAWQLGVSLSGRVPVAALAAGWSDALLGSGVDVQVTLRGTDTPFAPRAEFAAEVRLDEFVAAPGAASSAVGARLEATIVREPSARDADPPIFIAHVHSDAFDLARWAALAGQPALAGTLDALDAQVLVTWAPGAVPIIAANTTFALTAAGRVDLGDHEEPVTLDTSRGAAMFAWDGVGQPTGHLDLSAGALAFDGFRAGSATLTADALDPTVDGAWQLRAEADVQAFHAQAQALRSRDDVSVDALHLVADATRGARPWLPNAHVRVELAGAHRGSESLARGALTLHVRDVSPPSFDPHHGRAEVHVEARPAGFRSGSELALALADLTFDGVVDLAPDAPEPVGAVRGSLRGTLDALRIGPRRIDQADLDLTFQTPAALSAPWDVRGQVALRGVAAPEASVQGANVDLDLAIDPNGPNGPNGPRSQALITRGTATAKLIGLVPAAFPGHRFDTATVTLAARGEGDLVFDATFDERGRWSGSARGTVTLPAGATPVTFAVDDLVITDTARAVAVLQWNGASFGKDGWLALGQLVLVDARAPPGAPAGQIIVGGRIRLAGADGPQLELLVHGENLDIARWHDQVRDLTGLALPALALAGQIDLDLAIGGTFARPRLHATLELGDLRIDEHGPFGGSFTVSLGESEPGLDVTGYASWGAPGAPQGSAPGRLDVRARLPVAVGFAPPHVDWRSGSIVDAHLSGLNVDVAGVLALLRAATPGAPPPVASSGANLGARAVSGRGALDLTASGSSDDPEVDLRLTVADLFVGLPAGVVRRGAVDDFTHGTLALAVHAHRHETTVTLDLARASARAPATLPAPLLLHVQATIPHSLGQLLGDPRPLETLRARLDAGESSLLVKLPPGTNLSHLPLADLLPPILRGARLDVLVTLGGPRAAPQLVGHVTLDGFRGFPIETTTRLDITTDGPDLHVTLVTQTRSGERLVEGDLVVPRLAALVGDPANAARILEDPRLRGDFATADVPSNDLWELSQELGENAALFFPDAYVAAMLVVRGGPGGPVADAAVRVRTVPSVNLLAALAATIRKEDLAKAVMESVSARNFANDARIGLHIGPLRTELRATLLQEGKVGGEHFNVIASADLGSRVLLDGMPRAIETVGVTGTISAGEFRLEGLASSLRPILGSTRGRVNGAVDIDGTLGKPSLVGSLDFYFEELAIAPIGFKRDEASALVLFDADNTVTVEGLEFTDPDDHGKPSRFALSFKATLPSLDPKAIAVTARADFQRFHLLDKPDMSGRLDGFLALGGTLARPRVTGKVTVLDALVAPRLGDRSVRPIGLPRDVHFVRGEPEVPESRTVARGYRVPLELDVAMSIPPGELALRPTLALTLGAEVGANLMPHGELAFRTVSSELGIFGTLYVPRESIELYGRSFKVDDDSRVVFTGDIDSDPQLYFAARRSIEDVDLTALGLTASRDSFVAVRVTGNARAPKVVFSSNPPMDEQNVLSIIALGAPASSAPLSQQLSGGVTSVANSLAGSFLTKLTGPLLAKLPIDILTVDSSAGDFSDLRITVGKYITKALLLRYQYLREFGSDKGENVITFEYKLGSIFSIIGKASDVGSGTIEATFRFHD